MLKLRCVFVLALLIASTTAYCADLPADLEKAVHDYDEAQIKGNRLELQRLLADDYTLLNSGGRIQNKAELIADYTAPGFKLEPFVVEQPIEKVWSDGAVMGGISSSGSKNGAVPRQQ